MKSDRFKYSIILLIPMPIDTIVKDPENIGNIDEVDDILSRILAYEKEPHSQGGVLLIQRRQFG